MRTLHTLMVSDDKSRSNDEDREKKLPLLMPGTMTANRIFRFYHAMTNREDNGRYSADRKLQGAIQIT